MLSALEKFLIQLAGGVKGLRTAPMETLGAAAKGIGQTAKESGKFAMDNPKVAAKVAAMLGGTGLAGGYLAASPSDEEEEILKMYGRR